MTIRYLFCLTAFSLGLSSVALTQSKENGTLPQNYIFFGRERTRITETWFLSTPTIIGAQLKYTWRELEPERDRYDLDLVRNDLAFLSRNGKRLFIQIQDVSFDEKIMNVPEYLLEDSSFGGGAALKYEFEDDDELHRVVDGWVARRWDPAVRERFARLLQALAKEFDGQLAGINLPETSIGFGKSGKYHPAGYSYDAYYEGIRDLMRSAREAFHTSDVIIYANFMPGEELPNNDHGYLKGLYAYADQIGCGVGGPDLLPLRWFQRQNSLPLIAARAPQTRAGLAVQYGNLDDTDRKTGRRVTVRELYDYAKDKLHLDYIFWGTQEPHLSGEILPFLRAL